MQTIFLSLTNESFFPLVYNRLRLKQSALCKQLSCQVFILIKVFKNIIVQ